MKLQYGILIAKYVCSNDYCPLEFSQEPFMEIEIENERVEDFFEEKELKRYGWGIVNGHVYCEDCLADAAKQAFLEDQAETKREMEE